VATTGPHTTNRKTARRPSARAGQAAIDDITITEDRVVAPPAPPEPARPAAPAPPPAPPPAARELRAQLGKIEVSGSLSPSDVERAIKRQWPEIQRCMSSAPAAVVAKFTVGEARRAKEIRAVGATVPTNACVAAALADVRTEAAPDVGDVEVTVRITFAAKT
jgi:hypothetical protein